MPVIHISNGTIEDISWERETALVTVTYMEGERGRRNEQTVRLALNSRTVILDRNGNPVSVSALRRGMMVNAAFSSRMTRSIPPQAVAYLIEIVSGSERDPVTVGTILNVDRGNRNFTTISDRDVSTVIRFNVSEDTVIFDRLGRRVNFARLTPGMRVRIRHANFMTASIPPQTNAFEIRIL